MYNIKKFVGVSVFLIYLNSILYPSYASEPQKEGDSFTAHTLALVKEHAEFPDVMIEPTHVLRRFILLESHLDQHNPEKENRIKELVREGMIYKLQKHAKAKIPLKQAALYGNVGAMVQVGKILEENKEKTAALEWYRLAFIFEWQAKGSYNETALAAIRSLPGSEAQTFVRKVPELFIENKNNLQSIEKICDAYYQHQLEVLLSPEEKVLRCAFLKLKFLPVAVGRMLFLHAVMGKSRKEIDVAQTKGLHLLAKAGTPDALNFLADMLRTKKVTLERLREVGVLKVLGIRDQGFRTPNQLSAWCYAKAGTDDDLWNLTNLIHLNEVTIEELYEENVLEFLKDQKVENMTKDELVAFLLVRLARPESTADIINHARNNLANLLQENRVTLERLQELRVIETTWATHEYMAWLYAQAGSLDAFYNLGKNLLSNKKREISVTRLQEIGVLELLGIQPSPKLTIHIVSSICSLKSQVPDAYFNVGYDIDRKILNLELLSELADHKLIKYIPPNLARHDVAAWFYAKSGTPQALTNLGCLFFKDKITREGLRKAGILPEFPIRGTQNSTNLQLSKLYFENSKEPVALYNLGAITYHDQKHGYVSGAAMYFRESNTPDARYALASLYMNDSLEPYLDKLTRYQNIIALLEPVRLKKTFYGDKVKDLYETAIKLFKNEQKILNSAQQLQKIPTPLAEQTPLPSSTIPASPILESMDVNAQRKDVPVLQTGSQKAALQEAHTLFSTMTPELLPTKPKKSQENKSERMKEYLKTAKEKATKALSQLSLVSSSTEEEKGYHYEVCYYSKKAQDQFEALMVRTDKTKALEVIQDIMNKPWGTEGVGKPELLRGNLKGWWSRRLSKVDRLVYRINFGMIEIYSCEGHY